MNPALSDWKLSEYDLIETLWKFGHFFSPEALAVDLVKEEDLPRLTLSDAVVQAAVRSYQQFFERDLNAFTMRPVSFGGHERPAIPDGDVGESTVLLLTSPRCGVPDFLPPNAAALEANWPDACRGDITTSYRMSLNGLTAEQLQAAWEGGDAVWEKVIDIKCRLDLAAYPNTRIFAFAANLGGSVLADQYLAQNRCDVRLQGRFSTRQWTMQMLQTVVAHEHGHAWGIGHQDDPDATMFPSIHQAALNRLGAPNATDLAAALALGYRRRTTPIPPPDPPPTDDVFDVAFKSRKTGRLWRGVANPSAAITDGKTIIEV